MFSACMSQSQAKELKSKYTGVSSDAMRGRSRGSAGGGLGSSSMGGSRYAVQATDGHLIGHMARR